MKYWFPILMAALLLTLPVKAQEGHQHHPPADTASAETEHAGHGRTDDPMQEPMPEMTGILPGVPMSRDGSGTSWIPDASPVHAIHRTAGDWGIMFHGNAFLRFNAQDVFDAGSRGASELDMPNWMMLMAQRPLSRTSQIELRGMISLEPITVGANGYPLLFQTGETFEGEPLIDRQHPHDLLVELAAAYGQSINEEAGFFIYAGLPGEPALGPPAFMHRPSAFRNPDSPLGHHWQDATHIVFGVVTGGLRYRDFKLDASLFNGREPDENRYDIDRPRLNSYSGRISANPSEHWALQVSRGFLKEPEVIHPGQDQWRTTGSAIYAMSPFSASFIWGMNQLIETHHGEEERTTLQSFLFESELAFGLNTLYGRAEWVEKPAEELGFDHLEHDEIFSIGTLTAGLARRLFVLGSFDVDLGGHASLFRVPEDLRSVYGNLPVSLAVYLRLSPSRMTGHRDHAGPAPGGHMHQGTP